MKVYISFAMEFEIRNLQVCNRFEGAGEKALLHRLNAPEPGD